eukprot:4079511-Pyramimonas_sp.AAC.1
MADYNEKVQWAVRNTAAMLHRLVQTSRSTFDRRGRGSELRSLENAMGQSMRVRRRPGDLWRAVCPRASPARKWALVFCQKNWADG